MANDTPAANGSGRSRGPVWDNRITLGNLLTVVTIIGGLMIGYSNVQSRMAVLENEIEHLQKQVARLEQFILPAARATAP
jgi:hypothetical protein